MRYFFTGAVGKVQLYVAQIKKFHARSLHKQEGWEMQATLPLLLMPPIQGATETMLVSTTVSPHRESRTDMEPTATETKRTRYSLPSVTRLSQMLCRNMRAQNQWVKGP